MALKRIGNIYSSIYSMENLLHADKRASRKKAHQYGVQIHRQNQAANLSLLQQLFINKAYITSAYHTFVIHEPKEREIHCLPYFPDRIAHHAIMNVIKPVFTACFTADSYASIEGKGTHAASFALRRALRDEPGTRHCLKLDIQKFYPSIDHDILKAQLRRKFKDADLLDLLDGIIDSADGVPIGNYLSQYFANFYLTGFDHWLKQQKQVKYYFRYKDDMVILANSKEHLHQLLADIRQYLAHHLKLTIKSNYQVFPVKDRGIDFVGYVHFHTHVLLRKSIKQSFARKMARRPHPQSIAAYYGWAKHCNSKKLLNKLINVPLQRAKHPATGELGNGGRQNKDRPHFKQGDHHPQMGDQTIRIHQRVPVPADRNEGCEIRGLDRIQIPAGNHTQNTSGQIPINYNH